MYKAFILFALLIALVGLSAQTAELDEPDLENIDISTMATESELLIETEAFPMYEAGDQSLFILPTAYTMPNGKSAFTSYELVVLHFTKAISDRVNVGAGMVFPFTADMLQTTTLGGKINYLKRKSIQCAVFGSITPFIRDTDPGFNIGHVISIGTPKNSLHIVIDKPFSDIEDIGDNGFLAAIGGIASLSKSVSAIGELHIFASGQSSTELLSLGLRFKGKNISWDFGGIRPVDLDLGIFIALPFIKATFVF